MSFNSLILSGNAVPLVSGNKMQTKAAATGAAPNIMVGSHGTVTDKSETKGAIIEPTLIQVEHAPIPIFLTTVGKSSDVYM